MTDDIIRTDYALQREAKDAAIKIFETVQTEHGAEFNPDPYGSEWFRRIQQWANSSQHVIESYRAIQICTNCDVSKGEMFLEDVGLPEGVTFESLASTIVYGELRARISEELQVIFEEWENPVTKYSVAWTYLPALINGDESKLSENAKALIADFIYFETGHIESFHWSTDPDETDPFFGTCEITGKRGSCYTVHLVDMEKVAANRTLLTLDPVPVTAPTKEAATCG